MARFESYCLKHNTSVQIVVEHKFILTELEVFAHSVSAIEELSSKCTVLGCDAVATARFNINAHSFKADAHVDGHVKPSIQVLIALNEHLAFQVSEEVVQVVTIFFHDNNTFIIVVVNKIAFEGIALDELLTACLKCGA